MAQYDNSKKYIKYSKTAFFELLAPIVIQVRQEGEGSSLFPSVRLAQNWLETGGNIPSWNNLAGYKVGSGHLTPFWDGSSVNTTTKEMYGVSNGGASTSAGASAGASAGVVEVRTSANWRAYTSLYNFYKDQDLLFAAERYARVRAAASPEAQCQALQACGYATDPNYASKLISILVSNDLAKYDIQEVINEMTAEEKAAFTALQQTVQAQAQRIAKLEADARLAAIPVWAAEACKAAEKAGAVDTIEGGSLDFYRVLTVLYRRGFFNANDTES